MLSPWLTDGCTIGLPPILDIERNVNIGRASRQKLIELGTGPEQADRNLDPASIPPLGLGWNASQSRQSSIKA